MESFTGYLFCKLDEFGTRSEGPVYFLQQDDYADILVQKRAHPWELDLTLHPHVDKMVQLLGEMGKAGISYEGIKALHGWPDQKTNYVGYVVCRRANIGSKS